MAPALVSLKENPPKNRIENIRPTDWPLSSSQLIFLFVLLISPVLRLQFRVCASRLPAAVVVD
jgi:hypothetical protein